MISVETKLQSLDRDVQFALSSDLSPQAVSAAIAQFAREEIAAADAQNEEALGRHIDHNTFVDGVPGSDLERVRPDGTIVATWTLTNDVVREVWAMVLAHVPIRSGQFRLSQRMYADGEEVDDPTDPPAAEEYVITSIAPYARKIERGESQQAPNGVYQGIAAICAARFGNIAKIRFSYSNPIGGDTSLAKWATKRKARSIRQHLADTRQPSITISFR